MVPRITGPSSTTAMTITAIIAQSTKPPFRMTSIIQNNTDSNAHKILDHVYSKKNTGWRSRTIWPTTASTVLEISTTTSSFRKSRTDISKYTGAEVANVFNIRHKNR